MFTVSLPPFFIYFQLSNFSVVPSDPVFESQLAVSGPAGDADKETGQPVSNLKSMRSMSRSTFDSIIDDFIEDDWEKRSAFGVSVTVVTILTIFLTLLGVALSVSLGVQHGNQSKKLAFTLCAKVVNNEWLRHPSHELSLLARSSLTGVTWRTTAAMTTRGATTGSSTWPSCCRVGWVWGVGCCDMVWIGYGGNIARLLCCRAMSLLRGAP